MSDPQFTLIDPDDPKMQKAYDETSETISDFIDAVELGGHELYLAKLRFRDPDLSEKMGKDQFFYLWLSDVNWHSDKNILSGVFIELPDGFENEAIKNKSYKLCKKKKLRKRVASIFCNLYSFLQLWPIVCRKYILYSTTKSINSNMQVEINHHYSQIFCFQ